MQKKKKPNRITCPCCGQEKGERNLSRARKGLPEINGLLVCAGQHQEAADPALVLLAGFDRWACDDCLNSGRAIAGEPRRQRQENIMAHEPEYLAFWDKSYRSCLDCGSAFVFSKEEQLFYYQQLGKSRLARAVRCLDCRRARRETFRPARELGEMLEDGALRSEEFRQRVVDNYRLLGREDKARYFEKRRPDET